MKIFSPLNEECNIEELAPYAGEFYVGVKSEEWDQYCADSGKEYNARGGSSRSNFSNWNVLETAVKKADSYGIPCYLTVNAPNISSSGISIVERIIKRFQNLGGAGIICSGLDGMEYGRSIGMKVMASTILGLYNVDSVRYILKHYHPDRIILSRDTSYGTIKQIRSEFPDLELESFGAFFGCKFSNGFCFCTHSHPTGGMCNTMGISDWRFERGKTPFTMAQQFEVEKNHWLYSDYLLAGACGICGFYRLNQLGIDSLKVVGRELGGQKLLQADKELFYYVKLAEQAASEEEYFSYVKSENICTTHLRCSMGYQCYYPEISNKNLWEMNKS